ncbi:protein kinase rad3 [Podospora fimiseda]|uniref:non-specific serine/threonine protein kinase n=1 Tax=Podospora fimiseda TaxID=252190 RepID=A0AAN7BV50_9PEZI|nr:protein kinase rad3 [Podospora fimiseda]
MDSELYARSARPGYNGHANVDDGPPPSTLAAELVEDISATGSARLPNSDENAELKRLASIIEKVKNDPTSLRSEEERIEHNHLLIYVSGALFLKGLIPNDDDPFADHEKMRAQALQVINFLLATIKETPVILTRATDGKTFLLMGCEPLWLWILPKILGLLGHKRYRPNSGEIEGLCHYIMALVEEDGNLWHLGPQLMRYFQFILFAILDKLKPTTSTNSKPTAELSLPPASFLEDFPQPISEECTITLRGNENALRLAVSLHAVISKAVTSESESQISLFYGYNSAWIIDSLQPLSSLVAACPAPLEIGCASLVRTALKFAEIYSRVDQVDIPLLEKANASLIFVCSSIMQTPQQLLSEEVQGAELRRVLCLALIQLAKTSISHRSIAHLIVSGLLNLTRTLVSDNPIIGTGTDVSRAVHLLALATSAPDARAFQAELSSTSFDDEQARKAVARLVPPQAKQQRTEQRTEPPNKRRKTHAQYADSPSGNELLRQLCSLLDADFQSSFDLLPPLLFNAYPRLEPAEQCRAIDLVSRLPCAGDGTLNLTKQNAGEFPRFHCSFCFGGASALPQESDDEGLKSLGYDIFRKLVLDPAFQASQRARVYAMIVLRRLAKHSTSEEFLNVQLSTPGQWCLKSLHSSLRELRVAAGRTLSRFIAERNIEEFDQRVIARNRTFVRTVLKSLTDKDCVRFQETTIMAWAQMGRIVTDDELSLVVATLVGYLGHKNTIVSDCAFHEILELANFRGEKPRDLFAPFWEILACSVVKDLTTRPQTTNKVAELLQMGTSDVLCLLQRHALPWLVLAKNKDVIQKIAEARGETEAWQPCLDSKNLPHILALLLIQDVPDPTRNAMVLLGAISPEFNKSELVDFLRTEPIPTALELFKAAADANKDRRNRIKNALLIMASLLTKPKETVKKSHLIGQWLEPLTLGLTQRLVEVISQTPESPQVIREQKRHLQAMEEMVKLCGSFIGGARPLMSASLISALAFPELRSRALSCWEAMMSHMVEPDVESQIEATFSIVNTYYASSDEETKQVARSLIKYLLEKNRPLMIKYANKLPSLAHLDGLQVFGLELETLRTRLSTRDTFGVFAKRLTHENPGVVEQALIELVEYLQVNQEYLQISAICEHPDPVVSSLTRSLLDCSAKYSGWQSEVTRLSAEALGLIGCLDSNRLEVSREQEQFVVVYNFEEAHETTSFVAFLLENVLVKAFLSTTDTRFQGFLSYVMQELLDKSDFKAAFLMQGKGESEYVWRRWINFSENTRDVLTPFLNSKFVISPMPDQTTEYPIFRPGKSYASWIRALVLDLLRNHQNPISLLVFEPLCRLIKVKDLTVTEFLLPYVVLHVIIGQETGEFRKKISDELLAILEYQPPASASYLEREDAKLYYQAVFRIIDYCMRWLHVRKGHPGNYSGRDQRWATWVYGIVHGLDPELISRRALDCGEYARALFWLEPHIEQQDNSSPDEDQNHRLRTSLQKIYTEIDEPDSLEGISAHFAAVTLDQEALNHRKAGRWTAAQSWYEIRHAESPDDPDIQVDLLTCLKESGQYDALLNSVEGMKKTPLTIDRVLPFAVEASWATGRWETLQKYLQMSNAEDSSEVFNLGLGQALLCLKEGDLDRFREHIQMVRDKVAGSMTYSATSSLRACHDAMLKCHILSELEMIVNSKEVLGSEGQQPLLRALDRRLEVLGAYTNDKQYLLGVRRAAMDLLRPKFGNEEIASLWLASARLARKSGSIHQSFNAVLHAQQLGDGSALIENARLLYKIGHHRKAIQDLQLAIKEGSFTNTTNFTAIAPPSSNRSPESQRHLLTARAQLLLAKWLDSTGQTRVDAQRSQYQEAAKTFGQWEKGHYYLGRHYKKVLESEKALPASQQSLKYTSGEIAKLVIENYMRSLNYGTKYLSQTLPRILTLFLDLGTQVENLPDLRITPAVEAHNLKKRILAEVFKFFQRHIPRMPAYIFYTALSQIVARIMHPNMEIFKVLEQMILRVVESHPRQAIWSLFPLITAVKTKLNRERIARGGQLLKTIQDHARNADGSSIDLRKMLRMGEKLAEQLLHACTVGDFQSNRTTNASISRDLQFNHACTPCPLVVPIETCLTATLPTVTDNVKRHKAFSRDVITIEAFLDHVLVLGSLAKPRKLTARGSDGKEYGLLIKPKDDLRTDQRLMEFNGLINRSLKRDAESSRRQLYIRTYAVTPLNEECGIIEWVDGLKTLRDILLGIYKTRNITPNYGQLQLMMKDAQKDPTIFTHTILNMFPPVLSEWFISQFPNPSAWFAARLKYTRSCAVMSMVGTILGLGDRHGENVLLEEGNGGIFHVDFNCLFDKGLTFAQPECVPFRLTQNMQNAMGIYKYEGPFRQCSELTLRILRQQEETLLSILEAFIYDPTLDLQRKPRRTTEVVRLNPSSVVESIKRKVRGLLPGETIPLGVEGQVDFLIKEAIDPRNLTAMYIGWCPFL